MSFEIDISVPAGAHVSTERLEAALRSGLAAEGVEAAVLSVSVVDNETIHRLNAEHLQHDYPTDVISFQLEWNCEEATLEQRLSAPDGRSRGATVEGEIVASWQYAAEMAEQCGWSTEDELTLYVVHGMLHICGYDDLTVSEKKYMRARERAILSELGLRPSYPQDESSPEATSGDAPKTKAEDRR